MYYQVLRKCVVHKIVVKCLLNETRACALLDLLGKNAELCGVLVVCMYDGMCVSHEH